MYWRGQLKSVVSTSKKVVFWRNDGHDVTTTANEIVHYWGSQADTAKSTLFDIQSLQIQQAKLFCPPQIYFISIKGKEIFGSTHQLESIPFGEVSMKSLLPTQLELTNPEFWVL